MEWQSIERARTQLAGSARAIKDPAFRVSNPITQANASFKMRESADPRDRVVAELQDRIRALEVRISSSRDNGPSTSEREAISLMTRVITNGVSSAHTA